MRTSRRSRRSWATCSTAPASTTSARFRPRCWPASESDSRRASRAARSATATATCGSSTSTSCRPPTAWSRSTASSSTADLAATFLARFAEASDDFGLYRLVDFYLSYRAWVRGKVAAFLSADAAVPAEVRARKRAEAQRDFGLARSFSGTPLDRPFVVAVTGVVGSGKSTLAAGLGRELAAPVVASDRVRKAIAGLAGSERGDASLYTPAAIDRNYREVLSRAADVLGSRRGVILDATFSSHHFRQEAGALARREGARFALIEIRCPDRAVLAARLLERRRGGSVSDATDVDLDRLLSGYEAVDGSDPGPRIVADGAAAPAAVLAAAVHDLERAGVTAARRRLAS